MTCATHKVFPNVKWYLIFYNGLFVLFQALIKASCTIRSDPSKYSEYEDDSYILPDKHLCDFLEIPRVVSRIYLRDPAAFKGRFCLPKAKDEAFEELTSESLVKHVKPEPHVEIQTGGGQFQFNDEYKYEEAEELEVYPETGIVKSEPLSDGESYPPPHFIANNFGQSTTPTKKRKPKLKIKVKRYF